MGHLIVQGGIRVLLHDDDKSYDIIGEAALRLALVRKEITVFSLRTMLDHMAEDSSSESRLSELHEARHLLDVIVYDEQSDTGRIYLQTLNSLNEDSN